MIFTVNESESHSVVSDSLQLYSPWNSPGQITGVGSHSFLQRIFPAQESNWSLPYCRRILYQPSYQRSPVHCEYLFQFLGVNSQRSKGPPVVSSLGNFLSQPCPDYTSSSSGFATSVLIPAEMPAWGNLLIC